jgi:two-component system cell cycle response regulator
MATQRVINLLLVEDDELQAQGLKELLTHVRRHRFNVTVVGRLDEALKEVETSKYDVVLLDLTLPDAHGLDASKALKQAAADVPIVILTGLDDDTLAEQSAKAGVQEYLLKSEVTRSLLVRVLRYAIERNSLLLRLRELSLKDELTELYNRRGFFTVGAQQIKVAERLGKTLLLFYADVDGMKECNDRFGHLKGDRLLRKAARVLKKTFRESDVIGRLGGDEFAILSLDAAHESAEILLKRLEKALEAENAAEPDPMNLSVSVGFSTSVPTPEMKVEDLIREADEKMYSHKRRRKGSSGVHFLHRTTKG